MQKELEILSQFFYELEMLDQNGRQRIIAPSIACRLFQIELEHLHMMDKIIFKEQIGLK